MGRCQRIVVSGAPNMSENRGRIAGQFEACGERRLFYSRGMNATLTAAGFTATRRNAARLVLALAGLAWHAGASAQDRPTGLAADLEQQVRTLALDATQTGSAAVSRVEVVVGQLDPRLRLAPCQRVEPYLPNGTRLWGKSRIGLRCIEGAKPWNVYLPITVKVFGRALVATTGANAGSVLTAADLAEGDVDLAEDFSAAVTDPDSAIGRTLAQNLKPGQSLRQSQLKPRQWFAAGENVKVVAVGTGFSLESEGQALTNGIEGQSARVRTESGRVLTGQPVGERRLELTL